jgi:hypothetical protein
VSGYCLLASPRCQSGSCHSATPLHSLPLKSVSPRTFRVSDLGLPCYTVAKHLASNRMKTRTATSDSGRFQKAGQIHACWSPRTPRSIPEYFVALCGKESATQFSNGVIAHSCPPPLKSDSTLRQSSIRGNHLLLSTIHASHPFFAMQHDTSINRGETIDMNCTFLPTPKDEVLRLR